MSKLHRATALFGPRTFDADAHTVEWVLNSGKTDTFGTRIRPEGVEESPSMPLRDGHDWIFGADGSIVERTLGRIVSTRTSRDGLLGLVRFSQENPRGVLAEKMVEAGDLTAGSVEIFPTSILRADEDKPEKVKEGVAAFLAPGDEMHTSRLAAFAIVGVPADRKAIVRSAEHYQLPAVVEFEAKRKEAIERVDPVTVLHVLEAVKGLEARVGALTELIEGKSGEPAIISIEEGADDLSTMSAADWLASAMPTTGA